MPTPDADEPRRQLIAQLFAADRGKKADEPSMAAYLLALRRMDTARLARTVEKILDGMQHDAEVYRVPQAGRIWQVSKELLMGASRPPGKPGSDRGNADLEVDPWELNANLLLLNWITDPRAQRAKRYAPDAALDSPLNKRLTGILRKWALLWARDMREDRAEGGKLDGKKAWLDCMASADAEIDKLTTVRVAA